MSVSAPSEVPLLERETLDPFLNGRLHLIQSRDGYRFSVDAALLSRFVRVRKGDRVLDLGTGCGVMLLILLLSCPLGFGIGLELQEELASQARRNARLNGFEDRMAVVLGDIRHPPLAPRSMDLVICNPPYRKARSGRVNPDSRRAIARHEIHATLEDVLGAAGTLLRKGGRLSMVYPAGRLAELLTQFRSASLEPKRLQVLFPDAGSPATLVMVEGALGARPGLEVLPPLFGQGAFTIPS